MGHKIDADYLQSIKQADMPFLQSYYIDLVLTCLTNVRKQCNETLTLNNGTSAKKSLKSVSGIIKTTSWGCGYLKFTPLYHSTILNLLGKLIKGENKMQQGIKKFKIEQTFKCHGKVKSFLRSLLLGLACAFSFFGLTSCQSAEAKGMNTGYTCVRCTYIESTNETEIVWYSTIENESIYNMTRLYFKFDLYDYSGFVQTTKYIQYDIQIRHGDFNVGNRNFFIDGKYTNANLITWYADFASFWDTYKGWMIPTIIVALIASIAYIVYMVVEDTDPDEMTDLIADAPWIYSLLLPLMITSIYSIASSSWVPLVIILIGTISIPIIGLLGHLVKFVIENIDFIGSGRCFNTNFKLKQKNDDNGDAFNKNNIYLDDKQLMRLSMPQLKKICRTNGFKGYSKLSKEDLINHIIRCVGDKDTTNTNEKFDSSKIIPIKKSESSSKTKVTFDSIAGLEKAKEAFKEKIVLPFEHPEIFEKFGKKAGGGILLYGLPGTGKTMFAEAASNELNALFIPIKCSDIKSKWYGESERNVKAIFDKARKAGRAIIFFDEFEAIGGKRTDDINNINNNLVSEILAEMQGIESSKSKSIIMVIAATNKPWAIDSALMRPGRFDEKIYIPLPDFEARKKLFEIQLSKLPVADDLDYEYLANITDGFNGADIKEVCEKLKMSAIKDSLKKGTEQTIGMDNVKKIEKDIKSSVSNEDIVQLQAFETGLK